MKIVKYSLYILYLHNQAYSEQMSEYFEANVIYVTMPTILKAILIAAVFGGGWAFLYLIFKAVT